MNAWNYALIGISGLLTAFSALWARRAFREQGNAANGVAARIEKTYELVLQPKTVEDKIQRVRDLSTELDKLNRDLRAELDVQIAATEAAKAKADEARRDAEQAKNIAELTKQQIQATRKMFADEVRQELVVQGAEARKLDRRFQIWVAVASFFGGVVVTLVVPLVTRALFHSA